MSHAISQRLGEKVLLVEATPAPPTSQTYTVYLHPLGNPLDRLEVGHRIVDHGPLTGAALAIAITQTMERMARDALQSPLMAAEAGVPPAGH